MPEAPAAPKKTDAEWLAPYREKIDDIDNQIIDLLGQRFEIVREVGILKTREGLKIEQTGRVDEVKERNAQRAAKYGFPPEVIRQIYTILIDYAHDLEYDIKDKGE